MGRIGCPETSVENYHYMLRNFTERRPMNSVCTVTVSWSYRDHTVMVSWPNRELTVTYRDLNMIVNVDTDTETRCRTLRQKPRPISDVVLITGRTEWMEFY